MGQCFDTNGKYIGWSNLFDYSTEETLQASEYLPMPQKIRHVVVNDPAQTRANFTQKLIEASSEEEKASYKNKLEHLDHIFNLDPFIDEISNEEDKVKKIQLYVKLITSINSEAYDDGKNKSVNVSYTDPRGKEIIENLNKHEFTQIPPSLSQDVSKNFISSHIQNTVQDLVNMTRAYSPIEMEDFRDASNYSSKGSEATKLTLLSPATKFLMQYSNMTGKNVIGIAANGEKASFMWHYYLNDLIRRASKAKREFGHFQFSTNRIIGRAKGEIKSQTINGLPDLNMEGVNAAIQNEFNLRITGNLYVDLMISQVLSAATDNAKELILAKVNAGSKLAKMYLFLITVGMDINDIVSFMTSPVASFIDSITEQDIFNGNDIDINTAISFARGEFLNGENINPKYLNSYGALKMEQIKYAYEKFGLNNKSNKKSILEDCKEFENVLEGADEFSNFGGLLGLNQGLPTSKIDLQKLVSKIQRYYQSRIDKAVKSGTISSDEAKELKDQGPIDVRKWLVDSTYRDLIAKNYNKIKKCINIFDAFNTIKQFNAIGQILSGVIDIDSNLSFKSKAFNSVITEAKKHYPFISEIFQKNMMQEIDKAIISNFIYSQNISIPVQKNMQFLLPDGSYDKFKEDGRLYLDNRSSIASFKLIFENVIIPKLKQGIVIDFDKDGNVVEKQYTDLVNNPFLNGLLRSNDRKTPVYKVALNMLTIENSTESQRKYHLYTQGLQLLSNYFMGNQSLSDLFALYNLIINRNQYGASRLTTLFDSFVNSNSSLRLLSKYLKQLGDIDFYGVPHLDTDQNFDPNKYSQETPIINLSYKDIMISAAPNVRSTKGQNDPYVIQMTENGPVIMERSGRQYNTVQTLLKKGTNEDQDHYLERVNNERSYFVLGGEFSDLLQMQLNTISELKDNDNIISYINNFIRDGLLTVSKVCK